MSRALGNVLGGALGRVLALTVSAAAAATVAGCSTSCPPGADVAIDDGSYAQPVAANPPATPFSAATAPEGATLEVAGDVVTITYADEQGREVVATYHVVDSSLARRSE